MTHDIFKTEEEKKRLDEIRKRRRDRDLSDLKKIIDRSEGRRFLWRLLSEAGVHRGSYASNALETAFKEGKRDIGLFVLTDLLSIQPEVISVMQREAKNDKWNSDNNNE